jgi:hypothetical protein
MFHMMRVVLSKLNSHAWSSMYMEAGCNIASSMTDT